MPIKLSKNNNNNCFLVTDTKWNKIVNILIDKLDNHMNNNNIQNLNIPFTREDLNFLKSPGTQCFTKEQLVFFKTILKQVNYDDRWYQLINFLKNAQYLTKN